MTRRGGDACCLFTCWA